MSTIDLFLFNDRLEPFQQNSNESRTFARNLPLDQNVELLFYQISSSPTLAIFKLCLVYVFFGFTMLVDNLSFDAIDRTV